MSRIHHFIKGNIGGLVRHTVPSNLRGRGFRRIFTSFHGRCVVRGLSAARPCPNIVRVLRRLGSENGGVTMIDGGFCTTARTLYHRFFNSLMSITVNRHRSVRGGPTPSAMGRTLHRVGTSERDTICVNSDSISIVATGGDKVPYVDML